MGDGMTAHERIMELAEAIASPEESERPLLDALCTAAETAAAGRLKDGLTPKDCGFTFLCCCPAGRTAGWSNLPPVM